MIVLHMHIKMEVRKINYMKVTYRLNTDSIMSSCLFLFKLNLSKGQKLPKPKYDKMLRKTV